MMPNFKHIIFIVLICLLILSGLEGYFLLWPKYQEFKSKKAEMEIKDKEIEDREEYLSELEVFSNRLSEYSDELSKIDSALSEDPSVAALFNLIQKTSSESGLILTDIDVSGLFPSKSPLQQSLEQESLEQESSEQRIQKMPFSISVSGSYSSFKNFLSTLYKNSRLIEVKFIGFSSSEEEKDLFEFNLNLETQSYAN